MINRLILLIPLMLLQLKAEAQVSYLGKMWINGQEFTSNWYFENDNLCFQLVYPNADSVDIDTRMILKAGEETIHVISYQNEDRSTYDITQVQRIKKSTDLQFIPTGGTSFFGPAGECPKYLARTTTNEYMTYLIDDQPIDLGRFRSMFENDELFSWMMKEKTNSFPVQYVKVSVKGELEMSFLIEEISTTIPPSIWE
jgi:hypothetical protein